MAQKVDEYLVYFCTIFSKKGQSSHTGIVQIFIVICGSSWNRIIVINVWLQNDFPDMIEVSLSSSIQSLSLLA